VNRDLEIRQLLRAYRGGLMSEAAFEEEVALIEQNGSELGQSREPAFQASGHFVSSPSTQFGCGPNIC
jgi:hypothetical protein